MLICLTDEAASVTRGGQDGRIHGDERHRKQREDRDGPEGSIQWGGWVCASSGLRPNGDLKDGGVQADRDGWRGIFRLGKGGFVKQNHFRRERSLKARHDTRQWRDTRPALQTTTHHHYLSSLFQFFNFRATHNFAPSRRR